MLKKILVLFITFSSCLVYTSKGQALKSFSEDPQKFTAEISLLYNNVVNEKLKEEITIILDTFSTVWNANLFNKKEKGLIIENANSMLKQRISAYPDFYHYLWILMGFRSQGGPDAVLDWSLSLRDELSKGDLRELEESLVHFSDFFTDKTLFRSSSFTWIATGDVFLFKYDTAAQFIFKSTDLVCSSKKDSSVIYKTSGIYYPVQQRWTGNSGRINWKRVGFPEDSIFAVLQHYQIDLKFAHFQADSALLYNKIYFREPILGTLEEKVLSSPPNENSSYPQFDSYLRNYEIKSLFKNIDYTGGFSMKGSKLIGSGGGGQNAEIIIKRNGKDIMKLRSMAFTFDHEQLTSTPASVTIFAGNDSIYHPGLQMKYSDRTRELSMVRTDQGVSMSPFFNSYHRVDMDCSAMYWNLQKDTVRFETIRGVNRLSTTEFTSNNFYSAYEFYKLQGIDEVNPLYVLRNFSKQYSTREIIPDVLSAYMNKPPDQVKAMLLKLSIQGFLFYDLINDRAYIEDRLFNYIDASTGKRDYDVIRINSETYNSSNALLNLQNMDLTIRGVSEVFLSDSQKVYISPVKKEIVLKKNRDFVFTGRVRAGLFDFYAHECSFEYDQFRLNLPTIDSLSIQVKSFEKDPKGNYPLVRLKSVIQGMSGTLQIDKSDNKSGLQPLPEYPLFISQQESFVYYDKDSIYDRKIFKYHVAPLTITNLDKFSTDNLEFKGFLESGGIFPEIEQPLKVRPDYSLGFVRSTPSEGYPVYEGQGNYTNLIDLSNRGLRGKGTIRYLTSTGLSEEFMFYPDSLVSPMVKVFQIKEQKGNVEYPQVTADSTSLAWYTKKKDMIVTSGPQPFRIMNGRALFEGKLDYSPDGLAGTGTTTFENAEMISEEFNFKNLTIDSDTADFNLYAKGSDSLAVATENYKAHADFANRMVQFRTNHKGSTVRFPYNNFNCFMENIDWSVDMNEMKLSNNLAEKLPEINKMSENQLIDLDLSGSDFVSTNPAQDSLAFFSVTARYDLNDYTIYAEDVKLIRVADAAIFPQYGDVKIRRGGRIETLVDAVIVADTVTKYHHIYQADVDILSRRNYTATGKYYYERSDKVSEEISLDKIAVDATGKTFATGVIREDQNFWLSPQFAFMGNIRMYANRKGLDFEGGFRIRQDCYKPLVDRWVYFKGPVDPDKVKIPLEKQLRDISGSKVEAALYISGFEDKFYPVIFDRPSLDYDSAVITGQGSISYDESRGEYSILPDSEKKSGSEYFIINTKRCTMIAAGRLNLGLDFGYVDHKSYGDILFMIGPDSLILNVSLVFDFFFDESSLSKLADSLVLVDLKGLDPANPRYQAFLLDYLGEKKFNELKNDISIYGTIRRLPEELVHTFVLTDVNLTWNPATTSYISKGLIGISNIGETPVNRYVKGYIELIRRRAGNVMTIYFELSRGQWYFFDYRNEVMQTLSSDMEYNTRIADLKLDKRSINKSGMEFPYEYTVSSRRKMIDFLVKMETYSK
jgi:hypothetical protein